jgi:hypothetical protein
VIWGQGKKLRIQNFDRLAHQISFSFMYFCAQVTQNSGENFIFRIFKAIFSGSLEVLDDAGKTEICVIKVG